MGKLSSSKQGFFFLNMTASKSPFLETMMVDHHQIIGYIGVSKNRGTQNGW